MKKFALLVLALFCVLAIYNLKTPKQKDAITQEVANTNIVEETLVPEEVREVAAVPAEAPTLAPITQAKISTLKQILNAKNDNDPRMDTELKNLSDQDKDALVSMYNDMKPESLNDKGTIAFLIGREITRPEDAEFLKNVLSEQPCQSLDNCGVTNGGNDPHTDNINDVTLNYPQIVALNRIKKYVETQNVQTMNPNVLSHLTDAIKIGQGSQSSLVKDRATEIANLLTPNLTKEPK